MIASNGEGKIFGGRCDVLWLLLMGRSSMCEVWACAVWNVAASEVVMILERDLLFQCVVSGSRFLFCLDGEEAMMQRFILRSQSGGMLLSMSSIQYILIRSQVDISSKHVLIIFHLLQSNPKIVVCKMRDCPSNSDVLSFVVDRGSNRVFQNAPSRYPSSKGIAWVLKIQPRRAKTGCLP